MSFLIKFLVACCSINFLAKFSFLLSRLTAVFGKGDDLLKDLFGLKVFSSTEKDFLPVEIEVVSIFFLNQKKL